MLNIYSCFICSLIICILSNLCTIYIGFMVNILPESAFLEPAIPPEGQQLENRKSAFQIVYNSDLREEILRAFCSSPITNVQEKFHSSNLFPQLEISSSGEKKDNTLGKRSKKNVSSVHISEDSNTIESGISFAVLPKDNKEVKEKVIHKCQYCEKVFPFPYHLKRHMTTHTVEIPHRLKENFDTDQAFEDSNTIETGDISFPVSSEQKHEKNVYRCQYCGKVFPFRCRLKRHMIKHTREKPYGCSCGKQFARATYRNMHEKKHQLENKQ